jgi:hypothetical protein
METGMDFLIAVAAVETAIVVGVALLVLLAGLANALE